MRLAMLTIAAVKSGDLRAGLDIDQFVWELCAIYLNPTSRTGSSMTARHGVH